MAGKDSQKSIMAEWFVQAMHDYSEFYEDFVQTFKLSVAQCIALRHLCELAEKYGKQLAETQAENITTDELFRIYYQEQKTS